MSIDRAPGFTMRQLVAFVAVAETGTISAAAGRLLVSQSAVSLAVTELEKALSAQLCVRRRAHGVQLTSAGESLLARARALLQQASEIENEMLGAGGDLAGRLAIGCYATVGPTILPPLLSEFTDLHPRVSLAFREAMADELAARLEGGALDAVITYDLELPPTLRTATLMTRRPALVVPAGHRLAALPGPVELAAVKDEPMVLLDAPPASTHALQVCARAGFTPRIGYRSANYETVRAYVGRGLGWTIMLHQPQLNRTYGGMKIVLLPIDDPDLDPVRLVIAWRSDVVLSRVVREFISFATHRVARL
ncbi:LysR substrate-binding domain-containing protein [Rhodococcus sp. NPDC056960]|jgi:DNA-binding transcriptional LysR family regulator|uniref:LysR substrate-binding domain-containing protein n=1 Tax=Rhodococcus sp. NPDC056960 TaxID=3345982 RepID=UPI0036351E5F